MFSGNLVIGFPTKRAAIVRRGRAAGSGVRCPRLQSIRAFPEGLEGLGAGASEATRERAAMPLYEHVYLARQDASAQQVEELTAHLKGVIEGLGGKVAKTEYWGVKSLSYRLRKNRKAHFTLMNLDAPPAAINEIERLERLNEDVLRYLTIRVAEHEEGPSAMMRRAERDRDRDERRGDRGDRSDRGDRGDRGDRADRGDRPRDRDRRPREGAEEVETTTEN
jgi:small subunit ribosomal protein S6